MLSPDVLKKEEQAIHAAAQQLNGSTKNCSDSISERRALISDAQVTIEPRNGGCEPRVICEEVPVDRATSNNIISYPQCLEVYRCGGCCQETQFPCVPVQQEPLTFSPVSVQRSPNEHSSSFCFSCC